MYLEINYACWIKLFSINPRLHLNYAKGAKIRSAESVKWSYTFISFHREFSNFTKFIGMLKDYRVTLTSSMCWHVSHFFLLWYISVHTMHSLVYKCKQNHHRNKSLQTKGLIFFLKTAQWPFVSSVFVTKQGNGKQTGTRQTNKTRSIKVINADNVHNTRWAKRNA